MLSIIMVLRNYLGLSRMQLAKLLGVNFVTVKKIECNPSSGSIGTYQKLSKLWGISIDALLKNDFTQIPSDFFQQHPEPARASSTRFMSHEIGFQGEIWILHQEQDRVEREHPELLPLVRLTSDYKDITGYDILSFDANGHPVCIEVKTSTQEISGFKLSAHEVETAETFTAQGGQCVVILIDDFNGPQPRIQRIPYQTLRETRSKTVATYLAVSQKAETNNSGIARARKRLGISQTALAEYLHCSNLELSAYETGRKRPSAQVYLRIADALDVSVDDLLFPYEEVPCDVSCC